MSSAVVNDMWEAIPDPYSIEQAMVALTDLIADETDGPDVEELAGALLQIDDAKKALTDYGRLIEDRLVKIMPSKRVELEGVVLEVRGGGKANHWKVDELVPLLIRHYADPEHTGEMPDAPTLIERLREGLPQAIPMTPSVGFKLGAVRPILASFGHDVDEFATVTYGRKTVQITRSDQT